MVRGGEEAVEISFRGIGTVEGGSQGRWRRNGMDGRVDGTGQDTKKKRMAQPGKDYTMHIRTSVDPARPGPRR